MRKPRLTQTDLAKAIGMKVTRHQVANYEANRTEVPERVVRKLANMWDLAIDWFWDDGDALPNSHNTLAGNPAPGSTPPAPYDPPVAAPGVGRRLFPVLGEAGAAEFPLASEGAPVEQATEFVEFSDDLYRPERFAIRVKGDSMLPRIKHGTYALVQPDPEPHVGLLAVARNDRYQYVVKVLRNHDSNLVLFPLNPDYDPIEPGEGWCLVGYVVGLKEERGRRKYLEEGDNDGISP